MFYWQFLKGTHKQYELKTLLKVAYAVGRPEWLAKIAEAKTLTEIQQVFIEIVDASDKVAAHNCT